MGKWVIGALLAATAWTPMAQAQDGGWRGRHGGGGQVQQQQQQQAAPQQQQQPQQGGWQGRGGWGGNRGQAQMQAQVQAQARVEAQAAAGERRGGWNRGTQVDAQANGGWQGRRDWQQRGAQVQQQGGVTAQAYGQQRYDTRAGSGEVRTNSWARDRVGDTRQGSWNRDVRGSEFGNRATYGYDGRSDGRWNNAWRRDNRYDWNQYRSYNRNAFRLPRYYAPYGWDGGYRRFSIGVVLNSGLWGENYWIDDPYDYRLPEAYGPYRWVRYYNDALLVDIRSGVVVDTVYDIFWY